MSNKVKGKQIQEGTIDISPSSTPLNLNDYTVSATGSGKQLINLEYMNSLPIGDTNSLQEVTDIGNATNDDLGISDPNKGVILSSPNEYRFRVTINNDGQLLTQTLDMDSDLLWSDGIEMAWPNGDIIEI